ncbi:MAG: helix-turn-helix transcriptional regulator [Dehalococcoidia bacterium]
MKKLHNLVSIVLLLQAHRQLTAEQLAERLDVSTRTVYRDVDTLAGKGIPIQSNPGPGGGYSLNADVELGPAMSPAFSSDRALAMFLSGNTLVHYQPAELDPEVEAAITRVSALLTPEEKERIRKIRERIYFDTEEWYLQSQPAPGLDFFKEAVLEEKRLHIRYVTRESDVVQEALADPYGLVWKGGRWYVFLYNHATGEMERHRLERVEATETGERFQRDPDFDLVEAWQADLDQFGKGDTRVILRIAARAVPRFSDFAWAPTTEIYERPDGWEVHLFVDRYEWLTPVVLSYGPADVEVIEPREFRAQIAAELRQAAKLYEDVEESEIPSEPARKTTSTSDDESRALQRPD